MTIKVHKPYIKTENNEFRQIKPLKNLWKNLWILCITCTGKLEKRGNRRIREKKKVEKTE